MKTMERNQTEVWYALYGGEAELLDEDGNRTGEYEISYGEPVQTWMVISPAKGSALREPFGIETSYSKTMVTGDIDCPISEDSVLWIGVQPSEEVDGQTVANPYNYKVVRVAKSLNYIVYAIKEVDVA